MVLGIREDFTSDVQFDSQLTALPESGLYLNEGINPSITVANLLSFLPFPETDFADWSEDAVYGEYATTKKRSDIVSYDSKIYQSLQGANEGNQPDNETAYWLETNLESLKMKYFIDKVQARVKSELKLDKRLINNQFLYNVWDNGQPSSYQLPGDYSAWVFEPKGSDYVTIKLNQVSFQKAGTTPVTMSILNQGVLVTTKTVTPSDGIVDFKDFDYSFTGKGQWKFIIDSTEITGTPAYIDPLNYDGFVAYTQVGTGDDLESAAWSSSQMGNGIGWNVSVFLNSEVYIDNNLDYLAPFVKSTFELMALEMFLANPNNRSNRDQKIQMDESRLLYETTDLTGFTAAKRFVSEKRRAQTALEKAFDTQLAAEDDGFTIEIGSV